MSDVTIGPARADEVERIPEIERRASALFPAELLPGSLADATTSVEDAREAQRDGHLLVARDVDAGVVGFALLDVEDREVHLEELDVDPEYGRRGIGRALVEAVIAWGREQGASRITLSTFRDLAWNAPFYARCGFAVVPEAAWSDRERARCAEESAAGLDVSKRVMMALDPGPE